MSNADTVLGMYAAFGRGDIPAILEHLDEDVRWDTQYQPPYAAPWLQPRRGRDNIAGFFESMKDLEYTKFEPHTVLGGGDKVIAVIHIELNHKGKHYVIPNEGHLWTFGPDGKAVEIAHMTDTAMHWRIVNGQ